jgi:mono/diheme cytochrome c family protein
VTRPAPRFLPVAAACVTLAAGLLAACGSSDSSSDTAAAPEATTAPATTTPAKTATEPKTATVADAEGKQVFATAGCAGCHTLSAAGASGQVGPNLDQLKPDAATVQAQVETGGSGMPAFKDQLSPAQIKAVAAYVSSVAGQ